ncbi:hypothetical protein [Streptomyces sp. SP18CS02]|uniref:hypothetical protein n=1 Tax=Streptomyces sp. SP18CS02 TaxID=3002531 RepID=UPI002E766BE9|nr:hypothetical protein [Streptomyces sp. SP18CS02]MEE1753026.1 hypothetical protein [Streptomyces sp. SP18CS02]
MGGDLYACELATYAPKTGGIGSHRRGRLGCSFDGGDTRTAKTPAPPPGSLQAASALAAETGEQVEVVAERSEYTRTMANPDGTYTLTQSTTPQRARAKDASWRDIDVALEKRTDGAVGPKATVVDLSFTDGGNGEDLIRLASERGALELGWPKALPEPVLDGAMATYPEVYKGVDLQLTATAEGFREVLEDSNDTLASSTAYTPAAVGPVTETSVVNAKSHTTTTVHDFATSAALKATDANGKITESEYDGLGRVAKVWLPNRSKELGPV